MLATKFNQRFLISYYSPSIKLDFTEILLFVTKEGYSKLFWFFTVVVYILLLVFFQYYLCFYITFFKMYPIYFLTLDISYLNIR